MPRAGASTTRAGGTMARTRMTNPSSPQLACPSCGYRIHAPSAATWRCPECGDVIEIERLADELAAPVPRLYHDLMQRTMTTHIAVLIAAPVVLVTLANAWSPPAVFMLATILVITGFGLPIMVAVRRDRRHLGVAVLASVLCPLVLASLVSLCIVIWAVTAAIARSSPALLAWAVLALPCPIAAWWLSRTLEARCRRVAALPALGDRPPDGAFDLRCPLCDYALHGMRDARGTCPECGTTVERADLVRRAQSHEPRRHLALFRHVGTVSLLVVISGAVCAAGLVSGTTGGRIFGVSWILGALIAAAVALHRLRREYGVTAALIAGIAVTELALFMTIGAAWFVASQLSSLIQEEAWLPLTLGLAGVGGAIIGCTFGLRAVYRHVRVFYARPARDSRE